MFTFTNARNTDKLETGLASITALVDLANQSFDPDYLEDQSVVEVAMDFFTADDSNAVAYDCGVMHQKLSSIGLVAEGDSVTVDHRLGSVVVTRHHHAVIMKDGMLVTSYEAHVTFATA